MMRKDVRLGFAVGGVLLAVVVAYTLVVPGGKPPETGPEIVTTPEPGTGDSVTANEPSGVAPPKPAGDHGKTRIEIVDAKPPRDPFRNESGPGKNDAAAQPPSGGSDIWSMALNTGEVSSMMARKEVPTRDKVEMQVAGADRPLTVPDSSTGGPTSLGTNTDIRQDGKSDGKSKVAGDLNPSTRPSGAQKIHTVQSGELLSTIAAAELGSAALWPEIQKANNDIDPKKLKTGMSLTIPDRAAVTAKLDAAEKARIAVPKAIVADGRTTYEVAAQDSLYSISKKLYGNGNRVQAIYELNKDVIGPDMAKLKLHMILKLPTPPAVASGQ